VIKSLFSSSSAEDRATGMVVEITGCRGASAGGLPIKIAVRIARDGVDPSAPASATRGSALRMVVPSAGERRSRTN